ncbi:CapA family protein (plasmid) [Macrococcus psychrotolerans]|nr:CapA family protein [Macrococcus caseolyticus]QYA77701.1 CapA family protein [Macrococcus caseolyticus]
MTEEIVVFCASGDSFINRRLSKENVHVNKLSEIINTADVKMTNLETTIEDKDNFPSALSGGTWAKSSHKVLKDLKKLGFNLISWANNHTMDYSYNGLISTYNYLEQYDFVHAGAGINLFDASKAKYLEVHNARIALISFTSTFHNYMIAGEQSSTTKGRPGINPLRVSIHYNLTKDKINQLKNIEKELNINGFYEEGVKLGLLHKIPEEYTPFSKLLFRESEFTEKVYTINKEDKERIINSIKEAKQQSDYVILSIHNHESNGISLDSPPCYIKKFAKECIDNGADIIVGHGPHVIRGIEIYQGKPIFYSLGNFIFQTDTVDTLPPEYFQKLGLKNVSSVSEAMNKKTNNGKMGFDGYQEAWQSILPIWKMKDGKLIELSLYPLELGYGKKRQEKGTPRITDNNEVLKRLISLSKDFGTCIEIENNIAKVKID